MSKSIIKYKSTYLQLNDTVLQIGMYYLSESSRKELNIPIWYNDFLIEEVEYILDVKPVGWADLNLEEYLVNTERINYLVLMLNNAINFLNKIEVISNDDFNQILMMEEKEGYIVKKSDLKASVVSELLRKIINVISKPI
jgi:hypothetical protein